MSTMLEKAWEFFDACETGKGWEGCSRYCHSDASFSSQAEALGEVNTLEAYCEWMKGLLGLLPDGRYELKSFAADEDRGNVTAYSTFHGSHSGEGGPVPPTGRRTTSDYVYVMEFEDGRIRHMTKIWNDTWALKELGWA
jgi:predicted ester cyclase